MQYEESLYNFNNEYGNSRMQVTNEITTNEEIITFKQALELIKKSVADEKEDEMFYEMLIKNAPDEMSKSIIKDIRDDERKHNKYLRQIYEKLANQILSEDMSVPNVQNTGYKDGLEKALFGELDAVKKYRKIMGAMPNNESYILIMAIMTDELRHANKYNFLIHKARVKYPIIILSKLFVAGEKTLASFFTIYSCVSLMKYIEKNKYM